jgi:hypothetical protein
VIAPLMLLAIGIASIPIVPVTKNRQIGRGASGPTRPTRLYRRRLEEEDKSNWQSRHVVRRPDPVRGATTGHAGRVLGGPAPATAMANTPDPAAGVRSSTSVR